MELINQHTKAIMEGCKERARAAGLSFQDETLEYIVTNRDLLELSPKGMVPTLYDYWVHEVEVLKEKGKYELYPSNPYETVINTRPPISFYNDNNPDWLNVMIFYHVLGHIDFFQNNLFFRHTWDYDFNGRALSDKRLIAKLRSDKGRYVDYVIEFARGVDNLVAYHKELNELYRSPIHDMSRRLNFYFDVFVQQIHKLRISEYVEEVERYNRCLQASGEMGEGAFFSEVDQKYPEFESTFQKYLEDRVRPAKDVMEFILEYSPFLNKDKNRWMKSVVQVVRHTSVFFQPQIRTKILNEGWASYWHENLFLMDDRIRGHEVEFARVNAYVTSLSRVGLNPYALGLRLFRYVEESANKGRYTLAFQGLRDAYEREEYDAGVGGGMEYVFRVRENFSDYLFINRFVDQDFIDKYKLFVVGRRLSQDRMNWEYYIKSRKAADYRKMVMDMLYHPPSVSVDRERTDNGELYLVHRFEGKPLKTDYIPNTLVGVEYLWGGPVHLETSEPAEVSQPEEMPYSPTRGMIPMEEEKPAEITWQRVKYTMKNRKLTKTVL